MTHNPNIEGGVITFGWPDSQWSLAGEGYYSNLTWYSSDQKPTEQEINDMAVLYRQQKSLLEDILELEKLITPRRLREAALGNEESIEFIRGIENQISDLSGQYTEQLDPLNIAWPVVPTT